jgi:hypothetical protein
MTNGPRILNGENSIAGDRNPGGVAEVDCSAKAAGKATRTIEFFPAVPRSRPVSAWVTNGPIGGCQARHVGRSQTGLQGVGMLNTAILPEKPRNPERVLSVVDDRAAFEEKKRRQALALAQDQHLFADAIDVLHAADKYDYSYLWSWMASPSSNFLPT